MGLLRHRRAGHASSMDSNRGHRSRAARSPLATAWRHRNHQLDQRPGPGPCAPESARAPVARQGSLAPLGDCYRCAPALGALAGALRLALGATSLIGRGGGDALRDLIRKSACGLAALDVLVLPLALRALHTTRWHKYPPGRISFRSATAKSGPPDRLIGRLPLMRTRVLAIAIAALTACAPRPVDPDAPTSPPPVVLATAGAEPSAVTTPSLVPPTARPDPPPRVTREVAGIEFALVPGAADLRIETSLSRDDEAVVASAVASDIPAVEREFGRSFAGRPVVYVFASTPGYTDGFVRIFGYEKATATFVADNSVSFFEPSLRLIAVNWEAVRDRRPIAAIRHELTHLLTLDACAPRCDLVPAWLNEGQARLAEALVPGSDWRLVRVRYEAASMAQTGTLIPLNALVSQLAWNALADWAGYFKYQEAARAVELLREDIGGGAPNP